ncbi:ATP-binding protein [Allonocardiopsis opalescens]|uniref:Putative ATPase n=1 Tax=Allonocardiopsis opalescens TaxID=1144618 RepID=A0A2T0QDY4_9ACTN|nr:LuxR C-terminal-related transcriptional regulator [Allonocardiopsis opalescens]PRY02156.1 putative ATPase [Allonocardiopsis opalescens]
MTTGQHRHNLPAEPNGFFGRDRDVAEIRQLLADNRLVTLCGVGGIGKSRLATQVALRAADDFADGVRMVQLAELDRPEHVDSRIAATLGVLEEPDRPLRATMVAALRDRRMLLLLDTCEHLIEAVADLVRALITSGTRLRVLATSRETLRVPGETVWRVPPLSCPNPAMPIEPGQLDEVLSHGAIELFCARAAAVRPDFDTTPDTIGAVVDLCRMLDGIPLGIELAAAWVRVLTLDQILDRLSDRFRLLTRGDRAAPARQQTLRATVDWSHDLLSDAERTLLRRLSVFSGWSLDIAEEVCGDRSLPREDVLDLHTSLLDKSLVMFDGEVDGLARYRLLDTIRHYAAEQLAASGEETALRDRHRDYVVADCERSTAAGFRRGTPWRQQVRTVRRGDYEQGNLHAALNWSLAGGATEQGLRVCNALRTYWVLRGRFTEGALWLRRFLERDTSRVAPAVLGEARIRYAELAFDLGAREDLAAVAADGLALAREHAAPAVVASGLSALAMQLARTASLDRALELAEEAVRVSERSGDRWEEAFALGIAASVLARQGRLEEAERANHAAIRAFQDVDNQWGVARGLAGLGTLAMVRGDLSAARARFEEALPLARSIGAAPEIARCLAQTGRVLTEQSDYARARELLVESLRLSKATGQRLAVARSLEALASLAVREGQPERAALLGGAASRLRDESGQLSRNGDRLLAAAVARLGDEAAKDAWERGRGLGTEDAVAAAVEFPGPPVSGPPLSAAELTPREREISALLAEGLSNRAIGERLFISPATVARHLANIMRKLGLRGRTQVATWALREGLSTERRRE